MYQKYLPVICERVDIINTEVWNSIFFNKPKENDYCIFYPSSLLKDHTTHLEVISEKSWGTSIFSLIC